MIEFPSSSFPSERERVLRHLTFAQCFEKSVTSAAISSRPLDRGECQSAKRDRCKLCHAIRLSYADELKLKQSALVSFWQQHYSASILQALIPSPLGREYRTVTKRRVFDKGRSPQLALLSPSEDGIRSPFPVVRCAIEPRGHAGIYAEIQNCLTKPFARPLIDSLTYAIIKGNYEEFTVILNVQSIDAPISRAATTLSRSLSKLFPSIAGLFLYEDSSDGRYYLGTRSTDAQNRFRRIYGKREIFQSVRSKKFLYSPLAFSQVNLSMLDTLVRNSEEMLPLPSKGTLFDLYCGYGLFGLSLSAKVSGVIGIEVSHASMESAISNASRQKAHNVRFLRSDINSTAIGRIMHKARNQDLVILDPPRGGTAGGVIEAIASHRPACVLHIFCNIDRMAEELTRWKNSNYEIVRAVPLDMFPGTSTIEMMVALHPTK